MQELFISANNLGIKEEASIRVGNGEGAVWTRNNEELGLPLFFFF